MPKNRSEKIERAPSEPVRPDVDHRDVPPIQPPRPGRAAIAPSGSRSGSWLMAFAVAVTLSAAVACGGDGRSTDAAPDDDTVSEAESMGTAVDEPDHDVVAANADVLLDHPGSPYSPMQADCLAAALVDTVGGPRSFEELGITAADIRSGATRLPAFPVDAESAAEFTDQVGRCGIDLGARLAAEIADRGLAVSTDFVACIDTEARDDHVDAVLASGDSTGQDLMTDIALGCAHLVGP